MESRETQSVKARLNLKLDRELKEWVMDYAARRGTTVSNIIRDFFIHLYEEELAKEEVVNQI